jgi:DNA polymerase III sliding clamp (beta) subunit (PCNA family)
MNLKTDVFQDTCKTILLAVDASSTNLELVAKDTNLFLNVTNREYFCSLKYTLEEPTEFHATVSAPLFLNLIAGITTETFNLTTKDNTVVVKAGKSSYKLPMIYENDTLMTLPEITLTNKMVEMPISLDILKSIINVNSKEILKLKNMKAVEVNELQKHHYIDENGCFTFTTGAVLNSFKLAKPVKLLLNDRIVRLFKLFKSDVNFSFGHDPLASGKVQTKVVFQTEDTYLAAIITNDEILLNKVQGPYLATKNYISEKCDNRVVLSVNTVLAAVSRLMLFSKNSALKSDTVSMYMKFDLTPTELTITDNSGNMETVTVEKGSIVNDAYSLSLNLFDFKLVLESCKDEFVTMNCGNHKTVVFNYGTVSHILPEKN